MLKVFSEFNRAQVHAMEDSDLLQDICWNIVEV